MGNIYPFRFRREPEPDTPRLCILDADDDVVDPAPALAAARAGSGDRFAVFGDIAALARFADPEHDLLIDPARGNWDFFTDHVSAYARASAVEAFLPTIRRSVQATPAPRATSCCARSNMPAPSPAPASPPRAT